MKSKKLTYVLLIVVALIWYKVFFRVKANLFGEEVLVENIQSEEGINMMITNKDTVDLKLNYRDPFGDYSIVPIKIEKVEIQTPKVQLKKIVWPSVSYIGRVKQTESKNPLAIVRIDGVQLFIRNNEEVYEDFRVKKIGRDSISIRYKGESKIFWRN